MGTRQDATALLSALQAGQQDTAVQIARERFGPDTAAMIQRDRDFAFSILQERFGQQGVALPASAPTSAASPTLTTGDVQQSLEALPADVGGAAGLPTPLPAQQLGERALTVAPVVGGLLGATAGAAAIPTAAASTPLRTAVLRGLSSGVGAGVGGGTSRLLSGEISPQQFLLEILGEALLGGGVGASGRRAVGRAAAGARPSQLGRSMAAREVRQLGRQGTRPGAQGMVEVTLADGRRVQVPPDSPVLSLAPGQRSREAVLERLATPAEAGMRARRPAGVGTPTRVARPGAPTQPQAAQPSSLEQQVNEVIAESDLAANAAPRQTPRAPRQRGRQVTRQGRQVVREGEEAPRRQRRRIRRSR